VLLNDTAFDKTMNCKIMAVWKEVGIGNRD